MTQPAFTFEQLPRLRGVLVLCDCTNMKRICILIVVFTLALMGNIWSVAGALPTNQYGAIIVPRNLFRLKVPEVEKPADSPRHVRAVKFVGITSLLGGRLAILRVETFAGTRELSLMLNEGADAEGVRVHHINISSGTVRLHVDGEDRLLDIQKDAPKPGEIGQPGIVPHVPNGTPPASRL